jgi:hypothetical protein
MTPACHPLKLSGQCQLSVNVPAVSNVYDQNKQFTIRYFAKKPVIAYTVTPKAGMAALQGFTYGAWVVGVFEPFQQERRNPFLYGFVEPCQLTLGIF